MVPPRACVFWLVPTLADDLPVISASALWCTGCRLSLLRCFVSDACGLYDADGSALVPTGTL